MSPAEAEFRTANPCPSTGLPQGACKGHVVDRIIPRLCGGSEHTSNMQWLTLGEAKAKARWERIGCRAGRKLVLPGEFTSTTEAFPLVDAPEAVKVQPLGSSRHVEALRTPAATVESVESSATTQPAATEESELPHQ